METKLIKPRKMQFEHSYEDRPVIVTINPDLTADINLKGLPSTKFTVNLLEAYVASKKVGGAHASKKTFAIQDKEIVLVAPPAKAPKKEDLEITDEVIADFAKSGIILERVPDNTGPVQEL